MLICMLHWVDGQFNLDQALGLLVGASCAHTHVARELISWSSTRGKLEQPHL